MVIEITEDYKVESVMDCGEEVYRVTVLRDLPAIVVNEILDTNVKQGAWYWRIDKPVVVVNPGA